MSKIALEFGTNMFGKLKSDVKARLESVIDNPCQETWDDAHCIILNMEGGMTTLWQAVIKVDPMMPQRKPCDASWSYIPSKEIIIKAINLAILKSDSKQTLN
jgi:hypothetical protein